MEKTKVMFNFENELWLVQMVVSWTAGHEISVKVSCMKFSLNDYMKYLLKGKAGNCAYSTNDLNK